MTPTPSTPRTPETRITDQTARPAEVVTGGGDAGGSAPSILLVDDDPSVLKALHRVLVAEQWNVTAAAGGEEALEILQGRHFDLMITDLRMGAVDGWDLVFHEQLLRPDMTIFVITALPPHVLGGVEQLAAEFFPKPIDIDALLAGIHRHLGRRPLR